MNNEEREDQATEPLEIVDEVDQVVDLDIDELIPVSHDDGLLFDTDDQFLDEGDLDFEPELELV